MRTYTIGEIACRSGFSASALRYYEGIGLVQPATRTAAGYRLYHTDTLERLAFIARAKQLGCSLEEIADLVTVWAGRECAPVQRRFHQLVTAKLRAAQRQVGELSDFATDLRVAAEHLGREPVDGPCAAGCACLASFAPAADDPPVPTAIRFGERLAEVPIACTLEPGSLPDRLADWRSVLAHAIQRTMTHDGGLRIEFDTEVDLAELGRLIAAEQRCCAFFAFALTVDQRDVALEVRAPDDAAGVVAELFGRAA